MAESDDPFAAELERRKAAKSGGGGGEEDDPFAAELARRQGQRLGPGEVAHDVANQYTQGINTGVDSFVNLPYNLVRGAAGLAGIELPEAKPLLGQFNPGGAIPKALAPILNPVLPEALQISTEEQAPRSMPGRFAKSAGEATGASIVPSGTLLGQANRMAALAPTTTLRATGQTIGQTVQQAPRAAVAADLAASTSSGVAQQTVQEAGGGPLAQSLAGTLGAVVPAVAATAVTAPVRAVRSARVNMTPEGRFLNSMGDTQLDDLATGVAVGESRQRSMVARRTFDILGEEMVNANGNRQVAAQNTINRLQRDYGIQQSSAEDAIRRITGAQADSELFLSEYPSVIRSNLETRNLHPENVTDEAAGRITDSTPQWEIDRIANAASGASASRTRDAIMERLPELQQQFREHLGDMAPGTVQDIENLLARAARMARTEYDTAHNGGNVNYGLLHPLLQRIVERNLQRMAGRSDDQADALRQAINRLYTSRPAGGALQPDRVPILEDRVATARMAVREAARQGQPKVVRDELARQADLLGEELRVTRREMAPNEQQVLMPSLQMLQDMRGGIRGQMTSARQSGRNDIVQALDPLYREITSAMRRASPEWAVANRRWADMNLAETAQELGDAFSLQAGPRFRQQLQDFRRLAPEAQDVVRIHFVQKLIDKIDNNPDTHDLAKLFSTPHIKQMVRTVLGDEAALSLNRTVRDNKVATKSKNMLGGSQTARRQASQRSDDTDLGLIASLDQANVGSFRKMLLDWTVGVIRERRNRGLSRLVTMPVRDTAGVAQAIERMRQIQATRQSIGSSGQTLNQLLSPSAIGTAPISASIDDNPLQFDIPVPMRGR